MKQTICGMTKYSRMYSNQYVLTIHHRHEPASKVGTNILTCLRTTRQTGASPHFYLLTSPMAWCLRTEGASYLYLSPLLYAPTGADDELKHCYDKLSKHLEKGCLNSNSG
jgi:hypothetical protein